MINHWRAIHTYPLNIFQTNLRQARKFDHTFEAERQAIDVSGDGTNNAGPSVQFFRDQAVAKGILVNGLVILTDIDLAPFPRHTNHPASSFNGLKIEIQLRSQFQHAWATTVETVGLFLGEALKASIGLTGWLRFFP